MNQYTFTSHLLLIESYHQSHAVYSTATSNLNLGFLDFSLPTPNFDSNV